MGIGPSSSDECIPIPRLTFGPGTNTEELNDLKSKVSKVKDISLIFERAMRLLPQGIQNSNPIATIASLSPGVNLALVVLSQLLTATDKLHRKIEAAEVNIYSTLLEGKLKALTSALNSLRDPQTGETQRISETSIAIRSFQEVLPIFTSRHSQMYRRYDIGAPIFVSFYGVFKGMAAIAESLPEYNSNTRDFTQLKNDYRETLMSYKNRCIKQRLRSIYLGNYVYSMIQRMYFGEHLLTHFGNYFKASEVDIGSRRLDEGFEDFVLRVGHPPPLGTKLDPVICDGWDSRCLCQRGRCKSGCRHMNIYGNRDETWDRRLREYRQDVLVLMEEFFNAALE
jgi:hypothetical protein